MNLHNREMKCPHCESTQTSKNGHRRAKQNYLCKHCGRQFLESYSPKGYSDDAKKICLKMYLNGMGFRAIARVTGISHNTVINWVKQSENSLGEPNASEESLEDPITDGGETNLDFSPSGTAVFWKQLIEFLGIPEYFSISRDRYIIRHLIEQAIYRFPQLPDI